MVLGLLTIYLWIWNLPRYTDCRIDHLDGVHVNRKLVLAKDAAGSAFVMFNLFSLPKSVREHRFHPTRRWRFDIAWPEYKIAVEIDGGVWTNGRHTRGSGYVKDLEKFNAAAKLGWRVFKFTPDQVVNNEALTFMEGVFKDEGFKIDHTAGVDRNT